MQYYLIKYETIILSIHLQVLTRLTSVPFAAADDAQDGFQLATCFEHSNSQHLSLQRSAVKALGLYFDKYVAGWVCRIGIAVLEVGVSKWWAKL